MLAFYVTGCVLALVIHEWSTLLTFIRLTNTMYRRNLNKIGIEPELGGGFNNVLDYNVNRRLVLNALVAAPLGSLLSWIDVAWTAYGILVRRTLKPIAESAPEIVKELGWKLNTTDMAPEDVRHALRQLYGPRVELFIEDGATAMKDMQPASVSAFARGASAGALSSHREP